MNRRVAVTGIGMLTPAGVKQEQAWAHVRQGRQSAEQIHRFDAASYPAARAGTVDESAFDGLSPRLLKRMDRFGRLGLAAARAALNDSRLDIEAVDRDRMGVYLGNMYGGWELTDPSLRNLLRFGYQETSPYVASGWFATSPQGQISIHWQLKGFGKTVAADTASSALSLGYAARAIQEGHADVMLCGGAEAPVTPYAYTFCTNSGRLSPDEYRPFDLRSGGFQVGEGATILVLEELDAARARKAPIYGELSGFANGHTSSTERFSSAGSTGLARSIERALAEADVAPSELDYVGLDAQGSTEADRAEAHALALALGRHHEGPACTTVKPSTTHLLGAASSTEAAAALLAIKHGEVPPIAGCTNPDPGGGLRLVTGNPSTQPIRTTLVNSRGADGTHAALVFRTAA